MGISAYQLVRFGGICGGVVYCCRVFEILRAFRRAWDFCGSLGELGVLLLRLHLSQRPRRKFGWLAP